MLHLRWTSIGCNYRTIATIVGATIATLRLRKDSCWSQYVKIERRKSFQVHNRMVDRYLKRGALTTRAVPAFSFVAPALRPITEVSGAKKLEMSKAVYRV